MSLATGASTHWAILLSLFYATAIVLTAVTHFNFIKGILTSPDIGKFDIATAEQ